MFLADGVPAGSPIPDRREVTGLVSTYTYLRRSDDVDRTIPISDRVNLDVDMTGRVVGIETIGPEPLSFVDLFACLYSARFGNDA